MQEVDEGDGYSDDDLDALPADAFQELQQNAIRSTQQLRAKDQLVPSPGFGQGLTESGDPRRGFGNLAVSSNAFGGAPAPDPSHQASSDYGDFDDEMLDGEIFDAAEEPVVPKERIGGFVPRPPGVSTQREQWRQQRYGTPSRPQTHRGGLLSLPARPILAHQMRRGFNERDQGETGGNISVPYQGSQRPQEELIQNPSNINDLEAQVQKLLQERNKLQEAVRAANDTTQSKIGEIAIIRANESKARKENEKRILELQRSHTDEVARHKVEFERVVAEQKKIETEKDFLEFNLVQGNERIKSLQKNVKEGGGSFASATFENKQSPFSTPKKNRIRPYGDGFDDDEIQMISPPKLPLRPKVTTPKAGEKRKRKAVEVRPVQPLLLSPSKTETEPIDSDLNSSKDRPAAADEALNEDRASFKFTQQIMNHRPKQDEKRTIEALASFAYPSNPSQALSTIFFDKLSALTFKMKIESYPIALGHIVLALWSQCIDEVYYAPAHLLMELIHYLLLISPPGTGAILMENAVNKAQTTADVNLMPRFQKASASDLNVGIDTKECLQILHLIAYDCLRTQTEIEHFWRAIRFDFIVMIINGTQPVDELRLAINLLRTSVLETSFSMRIPPGDGNQIKTEAVVIDRLSRLLADAPLIRKNAERHDAFEIAQLQLEVLNLMEYMCSSKHCGEALATNKHVIGRLVRMMSDELSALYDFHYGHEYRAQLINYSTRLLYHLTSTSTYSSQIDLQAHLRTIPGGTHKYLVGLTRLTFSEGGFFERGIEEDTAEYAHQMLETLVNPQEAEALLEAFSTARK